jgi:hypothetical protein
MSSEPYSQWIIFRPHALLIVAADDHCCHTATAVVIRFGGRIQFRSPPAKHWAPFVRGCVPVRSDPGHDKGRLANRYAVKQALRGAFRLHKIVKGGFSLPRLALASGPLFTFFIPVIATVFQA